MIRKIVYAIAIIAIGVGVVNDIGYYVTTSFTLSETTREAAELSANSGGDRDSSAMVAVNHASKEGVNVYAFDYSDTQVEVYTEMPLDGTWALAAILTTVQGGSPADLYMLRSSHATARP